MILWWRVPRKLTKSSFEKIRVIDWNSNTEVFRTPKSLRAYSVILLNTALTDSLMAIFSVTSVCRLEQAHIFSMIANVVFKMQCVKGTLYFIFSGPCTMISAKFCHRVVCKTTELVSKISHFNRIRNITYFLSLCITEGQKLIIRKITIAFSRWVYPLIFTVLQATATSHSTVLLLICFCFRIWMFGRSTLNNGQPTRRRMCLIAVCAAIPSLLLFVSNEPSFSMKSQHQISVIERKSGLLRWLPWGHSLQ